MVNVWFQKARARGLGHAHPPFLNNNFQFGAGLPRLHLTLKRPGLRLAAELFNKLNPALFSLSWLRQPAQGDLSNKGSTPGASPTADRHGDTGRYKQIFFQVSNIFGQPLK